MTFWYVSTPYSKYPGGLNAAFQLACQQTALLLKAKVPVYCPIAHGHVLGTVNGIDPFDHEFWLDADRPMMDAAKGVIIVKALTWDLSYGIAEERKVFAAAGKPIVWMEVDVLPEEFCLVG